MKSIYNIFINKIFKLDVFSIKKKKKNYVRKYVNPPYYNFIVCHHSSSRQHKEISVISQMRTLYRK